MSTDDAEMCRREGDDTQLMSVKTCTMKLTKFIQTFHLISMSNVY